SAGGRAVEYARRVRHEENRKLPENRSTIGRGPADDDAPSGGAPADALTVEAALRMFAASLTGKSPHTQRTYQTALDRFGEYLAERALAPSLPTAALPADLLERYYTWLVARYGRTARATHTTYLAGVRAFLRFLERRQC